MTREKLYRYNAWLSLIFSVLTGLMTLSLAFFFFVLPEYKAASVIVFACWGTVGMVVIALQTWIFEKIQKHNLHDRAELNKLYEKLKELHDKEVTQ